jgi:two-component system cell cycle sensor histidine kinase/response regulator CckA
MFAPTPVSRGNRSAALSLRSRDAPETILVVDDDSGVLRLVAAVLQNAGYKILEATCGREGLKRFSEHRADIGLVLSDLLMPAMTGSEMIRDILRIAPGVRVMFMTGTTGESKLPGEYSKNNFIPLHKPFTIDGLIGSVEKSLATCTSSQFLFATPGPSEGSRR